MRKPKEKMNQATPPTPLTNANSRQEDISVFHFKRFLEAFSAPVADDSANGMQRNAKFRVLHVKRRPEVLVVPAFAMAGHAQAAT